MEIAILIGGHLSTAPRPFKEASALAHAGHAVTVHGVWFDERLAERDVALADGAPFRFEPVADLRARGPGGRLRRLMARLSGRGAREAFRRAARLSPLLFGYGVREMHSRAREANADLTVVHSEGGLWIASELRKRGRTVGVDFEDWFSEDLLPHDRIARPVAHLKRLERELARHCTYVTAASGAMARAIAEAYDAPRPTVVYNAFPDADADHLGGEPSDRADRDTPSLHWFSQTIGPGRGLELLCGALALVSRPVQVHLRGALTDSRRAWLTQLIPPPLRPRVHFHATVPNAELPARIAEHDVGLALEIPWCPNKDLTVSNKLFQYLQAGLAVVATDTVGQREIVSTAPDAGRLVAHDDPASLARAIDELLASPARLSAAKAAARAAGAALSWERQAPRLLELAARAVAAGAGPTCSGGTAHHVSGGS